MLAQYAAYISRFVWGLGDFERDFFWSETWSHLVSKDKDQLLSGQPAEFIEGYLRQAKNAADLLGLDAVTPQADRMLRSIASGNYRIGTVVTDLQDLRHRIFDQLDSRLFYFVSPSVSHYYTEPTLFGAAVEAAFPSASPEIAEAGKCRALGRHSATVFHLMRALEIGIRCLGKEFGVPTDHTNWHNALDQIDAKVRAMNSTSHGAYWKDLQQFYSVAVAHFYVLKNAWRNYAMHLHERYDEERATEIYNSVYAFMRGLAKKLKESP